MRTLRNLFIEYKEHADPYQELQDGLTVTYVQVQEVD